MASANLLKSFHAAERPLLGGRIGTAARHFLAGAMHVQQSSSAAGFALRFMDLIKHGDFDILQHLLLVRHRQPLDNVSKHALAGLALTTLAEL